MATRWLAMLTAILAVIAPALARSQDIAYVAVQNAAGEDIQVPDNRRPALYTGNFGDCLGDSLINVSRFDAAYYADNMTVTFHLQGETALKNESIMMYIGVFAYGEARFDLTFDPCKANINSLCPMNSSVPINAGGLVPIGQDQAATIPSIAFSIPDFEGQAILRLFANSTQSEIGCFSAVITNGRSFSHPASVGTVLGLFTLLAVVASFAAAIYGDSIPVVRTHYAHSLSVFVVFSVWQHIFYTGALSMNWPSVLPAFWSNFAWAGGMIRSSSMQSSINSLIGNHVGNTSQVGAAGADTSQDGIGGGYDLSLLYTRAMPLRDEIVSRIYGDSPVGLLARTVLDKRDGMAAAPANKTSGYDWYGAPVGAGLPLPGNYSGFAGTLAEEDIRTSNAFLTGFLWFLIILVILVAAVIAFKWILEGLVKYNRVRSDRLVLFRQNWQTYAILSALRICFIAFFMLMFLIVFQFSYSSPAAVKGIAALIFILYFIGIIYCVFYAYYYRAREAKQAAAADARLRAGETIEEEPSADSSAQSSPDAKKRLGGLLARRGRVATRSQGFVAAIRRLPQLGQEPQSIHDDEFYLTRFGWLTARFRMTRWWFFGAWLLYEFIRACFYAGASGSAMTQVFGLLVVEIIAFGLLIWARPFEGMRLNMLMIYLLGVSKVLTVALSAAFDVQFALPRITTAAIGIVIIVIQGILAIVTLVVIVVGTVSTHMSLTRNREQYHPRVLSNTREKYFTHIARRARQSPPTPPPEPTEPIENEKSEPYFNVGSVRRLHKIEDDDPDYAAGTAPALVASIRGQSPPPNNARLETGEAGPSGRRSRATSVNSLSKQNLPFGARGHRASWSSRDFAEYQNHGDGSDQIIPPVPAVPSTTESVRPQSPLNPNRGASPMTTPRPRSPLAMVDTIENSRPKSPFGIPKRSSNAKLTATTSHETLRGSQIHDSIAAVPLPTVRPRSGTWSGSRPGSRTQSRINTPTASTFNLGDDHHLAGGDGSDSRRSRLPLTPAVEGDEEAFSRLSIALQRETDKAPNNP